MKRTFDRWKFCTYCSVDRTCVCCSGIREGACLEFVEAYPIAAVIFVHMMCSLEWDTRACLEFVETNMSAVGFYVGPQSSLQYDAGHVMGFRVSRSVPELAGGNSVYRRCSLEGGYSYGGRCKIVDEIICSVSNYVISIIAFLLLYCFFASQLCT